MLYRRRAPSTSRATISALTQTADSIRAAQDLRQSLRRHLDRLAEAAGGPRPAVDPGHRVPFHWPPHPVSAAYHVLVSEWRGTASVEIDGERFEVKVARTPYGVFGRCDDLWYEARGADMEEMLTSLREGVRPLLDRQRLIARTLGREGRFTGHIADLEPLDLLALLFCPDRDIGALASVEIEIHATPALFGPALVEVLRDGSHPYRRAAQWMVLDLFEALGGFCPTADVQSEAIEAMRELLWDADDDYARAAYKAGVVLGGHVCTEEAAMALRRCLFAPSRIGRRSAIHGCFHLVEWRPDLRAAIVGDLGRVAAEDPEPALRWFAEHMASDIDAELSDHATEPLFEDEGR